MNPWPAIVYLAFSIAGRIYYLFFVEQTMTGRILDGLLIAFLLWAIHGVR